MGGGGDKQALRDAQRERGSWEGGREGEEGQTQ